MKRTFILYSFAAVMAVMAFTSCKPSRVWATKKKESREVYRERNDDYDDNYRYRETPPPPPRPRMVSLILTPSPGFTMRQHPNGGYYHQSASGLMYWKGYDNRFYLDRDELKRVSFTRYDYEEWKRYSRQSR
jgi:hypothetical protein